VEWSADGWLRLAHGGTKPQMNVVVGRAAGRDPLSEGPVDGARGVSRPNLRDDFEADRLGAGWNSLRVPVGEWWLSLTERKSWLRLRGRDSLFSLFAQSLIARRIQHFQFMAGTCLEFSPTHFTQMAGLICYYDTRQHYYLRVTQDEERGRVLGVVLTDEGVYDELTESQIVINDWPQVFLRAHGNHEQLQFSAAPDGQAWRNIGPVLDLSRLSDDYGSALRFTGAMIGLCAQDLSGDKIHADFDYFDYQPA
jgi:xylan 1,4-beta-xylosidase